MHTLTVKLFVVSQRCDQFLLCCLAADAVAETRVQLQISNDFKEFCVLRSQIISTVLHKWSEIDRPLTCIKTIRLDISNEIK